MQIFIEQNMVVTTGNVSNERWVGTAQTGIPVKSDLPGSRRPLEVQFPVRWLENALDKSKIGADQGSSFQ